MGTEMADEATPNYKLLMMMVEITETARQIAVVTGSEQPVPTKAGFVFEELHAGTNNLDAIGKDLTTRSYTERRTGFNVNGLKRNSERDIDGRDGDRSITGAQLKCYGTPEDTASAFAVLNEDGQPKYEGLQYVGPSDQIDEGRDSARRRELRNIEIRPAVSAANAMVAENLSDRFVVEGAESKPISLAETKAYVTSSDVRAENPICWDYARRVIEDECALAKAAGRAPNLKFLDDDHERFLANGVIEDVLEAMDEDGCVTFESTWDSTDPDYADDPDFLVHLEETRDRFTKLIAEVAVK